MTLRHVLDLAIRSGVFLSLNHDNVKLTALADGGVPESLVALCREHKPAILTYLRWRERADTLLLESSRRLADAWPAGCPLEGREWQRHEDALHWAYWSQDRAGLERALQEREQYALSVFAAASKERQR